MSNELFLAYQGTATLYAVLRRVSDFKVWSVAASAWATFADGSLGDYDVPLANQGGDLYAADMPASIASGTDVAIAYYEQAGASPATTDLIAGRQATRWITSTIGAGGSTDLISVARAQQAEQLADVDATLLAVYITASSRAIVAYCGREFASQTFTEKYDGDGTDELKLRQFPVTSLTTVTIEDTDGTDYEIATGQFRIEAESGKIKFIPHADDCFSWFPDDFQNVTVVYVAGYATVPEHVQQACVLTVIGMASDDKLDPRMQSESLGGYSYTRASADEALPRGAKALLASERIVRIA